MRELTLEITNQCINRCLHCSSNCIYDKNNIVQLTLEDIKKLIKKYEPEIVNISGGEPFEHPNIYEILGYLKENNIKHRLYTSLYPLGKMTKETQSKILNLFKNNQLLTVVLPLHSFNNSINDLFMGNEGLTEELKNDIKYLIKMNISITVHIVPTLITIYTLEDTVKYLIDLGINNIKILKLVVQGRCKNHKDIEVCNNSLKDILTKISKKYGNKVILGLPFNECHECIAGKEKLVVMCDGSIVPCESYKDGKCLCSRISLD